MALLYVPVAVPDKIFGLTHVLDFIDRGHSLRSLYPPLAALPSLPPSICNFFHKARACESTPGLLF